MMADEEILFVEAQHETATMSIPTDTSDINNGNGDSEKKRTAPETLEQNVTKVAKITTGKDDDSKSETEIKEEPGPKDEEIARLKKIVRKAKEEITQLKEELQDVNDQLDEASCRKAELEAREKKRIEKEKLVEADMHAVMKLAAKDLRAQQKLDGQKKEKDMQEKYNDKLADQLAKKDDKCEKEKKGLVVKALKREKELKDKLTKQGEDYKTQNEDHKNEMKELKENQKQALKGAKPEHSQAMKEKVKELKAKDKKIADLEKTTQSMDTLMAEKETVANELKSQKAQVKELLQVNKKLKAKNADMEGQYEHKFQHEGARWKIQNDAAEDAKLKLIVQQRSNFALRMESNVKNNRIQALQHQVQTLQQLPVAQQQHDVPTADAAVQSVVSTADASVQTSGNVNKTIQTLNANDIAEALGMVASSATTPSRVSTPSSEYNETESGGLERVERI